MITRKNKASDQNRDFIFADSFYTGVLQCI